MTEMRAEEKKNTKHKTEEEEERKKRIKGKQMRARVVQLFYRYPAPRPLRVLRSV